MGHMARAYLDGYQAAMREVYALLTEGEGRTEAYEATLTHVNTSLGGKS